MKNVPSPMFISPGKGARTLKRLSKVHREFDESYLQELLVNFPQLLPVNEIRGDAGNLVCIGREVNVGDSGAIDNLYVSTGGYPVVVETKLWKNPQARREVLSQILDYVKELIDKDYEWFDKQWISFSKSREIRSFDLIDKLNEFSDDELDQQTYIDRFNRALDRGDVIALIVGDGIETRLQSLVSHLCRESAHLRYSLALIELACYHLDDQSDTSELLVVPRIVQEVEPIIRAYVRVDFAKDLEKQLTVTPIFEATDDTKGKKRVILSEEEFFNDFERSVGSELRRKTETFYNDILDNFGLEPDFKIAAVMLKIPDPNGEKLGVSIIAIEKQGRIYNTKHIKKQLGRWGIAKERVEDICKEYWNELHSIEQCFLPDGINHLAQQQFVPISLIADKFDQIKDAIGRVVIKIRNEADLL